MKTGSGRAKILGIGIFAAALCVGAAPAGAQSQPRRILVTVAEAFPEPLTAVELDLRISKKSAEVTRVYQPQERPVQLALLVDDSTGAEVAQSLSELAAFLRSLPAGSEAMVAYLRRGNLDLVQPFTPDLAKAAEALRAPSGNPTTAPGELGQLFTDALAHFPESAAGRPQIVYVGEGSGTEDPYHDVPLNRALALAQKRGVAVWTIHASGAIVANHVAAETSLQRLSQETGGKTFALGLHPPTVGPYLDHLRPLLDQQYLVEFTPPTDKNGKPVTGKLTIAVRGRKEVRLLHPQR